MARIAAFFLLAMLSLQLQAVPPMCVASAPMIVDSAQGDFRELAAVTLTLTGTTGQEPTGMVLEYGEEKVELTISESLNEDGVMHYWATLANENPTGERFSVSLTETSSSTGTTEKTWQASVRSGFGWCGTMDSTMEISGYPVYFNQ